MNANVRTWCIAACLFLSTGSLSAQQPLSAIQPAADAPQPLSPIDSAASIRLPDGFAIDLIAAEPVVTEPSCIAWDDRGRLFVCELHGYNIEGHLDVIELNKSGELDKQVRRIRWELQDGEIADRAAELQHGVVKMLRDTDGDGVMDESIVWADDLPACYGIVAARGGVIVTCSPDIVFLADRDGDGRPEVRQTLFTGFEKRVMERGINNPRWGVDNWIYVGGGGEGGTITGPNLPSPVVLGNTDFRIQPDGSSIEPVNGRVGTFGMTINDVGDRFPASGGQPAIYALPLPYRYLQRNPWVDSPATNQHAVDYNRGYRISQPHPWRVRRGQDPQWVKFYGDRETNSNYFSGGCSNEHYGDPLFPDEFHGNLFYCEPSLNIVHRCIIERDGAAYLGRRAAGEQESEFLASTDQWFRPMNLRVGPDGALYIVDMYREIIEDYSAIPRFLQQQYGLNRGGEHGRIWRLRPKDVIQIRKPESFNLTRVNNQQLAKKLDSPYRWIRQTASRLLVERRPTSVIESLAKMVHPDANANTCIAAMYTLQGMGESQPDVIQHALHHPHYSVRIHALRLCEHWLATDPRWIDRVATLLDDPDPSVRLQLAMTLGQSSHDSAAKGLSQLARHHGQDRWMSTAILSSSVMHAETLLIDLLQTRGQNSDANPLIESLAKTVASQRDGTALAHVLNELLTSEPTAQRDCLRGLLEGFSRGQEPAPPSDDGYAALSRLMKSDAAEVRDLVTQLAPFVPLADSEQLRAIFAKAAATAGDESSLTDERAKAAATLASAPADLLVRHVGPLLDSRQALELQLAAVRSLRASTDPRIGEVLLRHWTSATPSVRAAVMEALIARADRHEALIRAIEDGMVSSGDLSELQKEVLLRSNHQSIAHRAETLFASSIDGELQARMERYREALGGPSDARHGEAAFRQHCLPCHQLGGEGHRVGPPLGTIVNRPDETLLLDLLDPSGRIEPEYRSYLVLTKDGRSVAGVLASETATGVVLRKEKGVEESVLRTDIERMKASEVSLMPGNLHEQLTPTDLNHLITFMRKAYQTPKSP